MTDPCMDGVFRPGHTSPQLVDNVIVTVEQCATGIECHGLEPLPIYEARLLSTLKSKMFRSRPLDLSHPLLLMWASWRLRFFGVRCVLSTVPRFLVRVLPLGPQGFSEASYLEQVSGSAEPRADMRF